MAATSNTRRKKIEREILAPTLSPLARLDVKKREGERGEKWERGGWGLISCFLRATTRSEEERKNTPAAAPPSVCLAIGDYEREGPSEDESSRRPPPTCPTIGENKAEAKRRNRIFCFEFTGCHV
ncbi:hypothetical protein U1Q18_005158 [Sarracenia purpurea var. burkii]